MNKIGKLSYEEYVKFHIDKDPYAILDLEGSYEVGDTAIKVKNAKSLDVYKSNQTYYVVIRPFNEELAFAYSIYPVAGKNLNNDLLRQLEAFKNYVILVKKDNNIKAISKERISYGNIPCTVKPSLMRRFKTKAKAREWWDNLDADLELVDIRELEVKYILK